MAVPASIGASTVATVSAPTSTPGDAPPSGQLRTRALRWPEVPVRRPLEGPLWMLGGLVAAVLMTWPLARRLGSHVPHSTADPLAQAWHIAWAGHGLRTQPLSLYEGNTYWPDGPSVAFADAMLGYAPAAFFGSGPVAALVRYNLLFLFAYGLVFAAAGLLAREIGLRVPAAVLVAVAAAFTPTRTMQNNHLNVLSVGGVVLTLFLLLSAYRRGRRWQVLAGWAAAIWQMSIGFAMGIWFAYLLALLAAVVAAGWWWRGRPPVPRRMVAPTLVGAGAFGVCVVLLLLPYLQVLAEYPEAAKRERVDVAFFSPPPRALLAAAPESRLWGERTADVRGTLGWPTEQTIFPGVTVVLLAMAGLRWRRMSRAVRIGLFVGGGMVLLLGFGPRLEDGLLYDAAYRHLPGWANIRTPGRLAFLWTLVLALLAGMGAQRILDAVAERRARHAAGRRPPAAAGAAAVALLTALVAYEGAVRLPLLPVASPPVPLSSLAGPQLHLPSDFYQDPHYMLWSTDGFPLIANGAGSFDPPVLKELRALGGFPDASSVAVLRARGIRTVVVHRRNAPGTPWEAAFDRPVDGLGIGREDVGGAVLFDLDPAQ